MKQVERKFADACVKAYSDKIAPGGASKVTTAVGFDAQELADWIKKVAPYSSQIQIRFGIYTAPTAPRIPPTKNLGDTARQVKVDQFTDGLPEGGNMDGRTTVFLYPCDDEGNPAIDDDGEELPPVNQGSLYP